MDETEINILKINYEKGSVGLKCKLEKNRG